MGNRDYSLLGPNGRHALRIGLAAADWYHTDIPRADMKSLMRRRDGPALRDSVIYYGAMVSLASAGIAAWPFWWSFPIWIAYSVLYSSGADSRWHEAGHGTAFRTGWMNGVVYHIACFMLLRNPTLWRWSHARHHTDTIIVGRDPEIVTMRPPAILKALLLFFGSHQRDGFVAMLRHAAIGLNDEEKDYVPESERGRATSVARIWTSVFATTLGIALWTGSLLPFMVVGLGPAVLGSWHFALTGLLQHTGMADNVIDHRLNTRTLYLNPVSRFIYWNMNYHVEHHMFPMVPYHALPKLHEMIKHDLPEPNSGLMEGMGEVISALRRQLTDPEYRIEKTLPKTARPYRTDLHDIALDMPAAG